MANVAASQRIAGTPRRPAMVRPDGTLEEFAFYCPYEPGQRVLDVGCGPGFHLRQLLAHGCDAVGLEIDGELVKQLQAEGLPVVAGTAEKLPFPAATFDGVISSVAIPYTDERQAIAEWARVLKPGGRIRASYHGYGVALEWLLGPGQLSQRWYGTRNLFNSWYYGLVGRRLPWPLGDSLCQSSRRLKKYYERFGLDIVTEYIHPGPAGYARFVYHDLIKR